MNWAHRILPLWEMEGSSRKPSREKMKKGGLSEQGFLARSCSLLTGSIFSPSPLRLIL